MWPCIYFEVPLYVFRSFIYKCRIARDSIPMGIWNCACECVASKQYELQSSRMENYYKKWSIPIYTVFIRSLIAGKQGQLYSLVQKAKLCLFAQRHIFVLGKKITWIMISVGQFRGWLDGSSRYYLALMVAVFQKVFLNFFFSNHTHHVTNNKNWISLLTTLLLSLSCCALKHESLSYHILLNGTFRTILYRVWKDLRDQRL